MSLALKLAPAPLLLAQALPARRKVPGRPAWAATRSGVSPVEFDPQLDRGVTARDGFPHGPAGLPTMCDDAGQAHRRRSLAARTGHPDLRTTA